MRHNLQISDSDSLIVFIQGPSHFIEQSIIKVHMRKSVVIPQDIIDSVIEAVGYNKRLLEQCSLVSSSFLLPSRKLLFSRITLKSDETCQRIHQFLLQNPVIQSFVRKITLLEYFDNPDFDENPDYEWLNSTSLLAVLRLPFSLEHFSIKLNLNVFNLRRWDWHRFGRELKDALLNIIHSSNLKILYLEGVTNLPITFFPHIVHLKKLKLELLSLDEFGNKNSRSLTSKGAAPMPSHTVIDRCVWRLDTNYVRSKRFPSSAFFLLIRDTESFAKPVILPFMCRLRFFEIYVNLGPATLSDFGFLSLLMSSLCISLTSPATLEHLKLKIRFRSYSRIDNFDCAAFYENLRNAEVWSHLDSITSHPAGSQLRRVGIFINYSFCHDIDTDGERVGPNLHNDEDELDDGDEPDVVEVVEAVLDGLPLLCSKDILFVKADSGNLYARHAPGMSRSTDSAECDELPGIV